jgi:exosortase E/protease (VPEID-CTERM system)
MDSKGAMSEDFCPHSWLFSAFPNHLLGRLYLLAAILAVENLVVSGALQIHTGMNLGTVPVAIVSFAVFLGLGHPWLKAQREIIPLQFAFLGAYLACVAAAISVHLLSAPHGTNNQLAHAAAFIILLTFALKYPLLALACIPFRIWLKTFRATSPLWLYALVAGLAAFVLHVPFRRIWTATNAYSGHILQVTTFHSVRTILHRVLPDVADDVANLTIGTPRFSVIIMPTCSGMEGIGLILAFSVVWLLYIRKQIRFPQVLLLIPCAVLCMWILNVIRLSVLILLGNEFGAEVAMVGFHSQFGWIAFTAVALAFCMVTEKLSWLRKVPSQYSLTAEDSQSDAPLTDAGAREDSRRYLGESPAVRAYLVPFLAVLAATFVSKAASGYFEWLYPLRFVAGAVALVYFWPALKELDWHFSWVGPTAGLAVFLAWIAPALWARQHAVSRLGTDLAQLSPTARWIWIAFRVAAAIITVPLAEELAFRGYLARRLTSLDFDRVSFAHLTSLSVALSSVAFGLMHGQHWLVGILAGLAYALALRAHGRMGDAVVAHAVSNLLLAIWVLGFSDWALW